MKICSYCNKEREEIEFMSPDGKQLKTCTVCREKKREAGIVKYRIAREKDGEALNRRQREYRAANLEKMRAWDREHYEKNRETKARQRKESKERNKEEFLRKRRIWEENNKDKMRGYAKKARESFCSYETFKNKLLIDDKPTKGENGVLLVRCKFCGSFFAPIRTAVNNRISAINGRVRGEMNFYCSEECRKACPIYLKKIDPFREVGSPERNPLWAKAVKERDGYRCVKCGETKNLRAHHIDPVGMLPEYVNDLDNGVTLCEKCHREIHRESGCTIKEIRDSKKERTE